MKTNAHRYFTPAIAAAASMLVAPIASADAPKPVDLRARASALLAPLPDRMPGAEKDTPELVALGSRLFRDTRLSKNQTQSCNSCHAVDPGRAGVDNEATSLGAFGKRGGRNSPTVLNAGFHVAQFWDGRAATLEDQAKGPVLNPIEMAMPDEKEVLARIGADAEYVTAFQKAFPGQASPITYDNFARAVASFERTLVTRDRFDDFLKGDDNALAAPELKGLDTFLTVGCTGCHNGPLIGAGLFQKIGLLNPYENTSDLGRFEVTRNEADKFVFKVPSLRNVALTGPFFHDGAVATLPEAVSKIAWLQLGKKLSTEERDSIVAFLHTLSDKGRAGAKKSVTQ